MLRFTNCHILHCIFDVLSKLITHSAFTRVNELFHASGNENFFNVYFESNFYFVSSMAKNTIRANQREGIMEKNGNKRLNCFTYFR